MTSEIQEVQRLFENIFKYFWWNERHTLGHTVHFALKFSIPSTVVGYGRT